MAGYLAWPTMAVSLGQRIRDLRTAQGLTLRGLAAQAGISFSYLNDLEHDRSPPALRTLQAIAVALGLNARDLLKDVDPYGL